MEPFSLVRDLRMSFGSLLRPSTLPLGQLVICAQKEYVYRIEIFDIFHPA